MRDSMILVSIPSLISNELVRLSVPGQLRRVASIGFQYAGATVGDRATIQFGTPQSPTFFATKSSRLNVVAGGASFFLGGVGVDEQPQSFNPATGVYTFGSDTFVTGPLPNLWFGPEPSMALIIGAMLAPMTVTNVQILVEIKKLDGLA